jgi:hypothetical protein
MAAYTKLTSSKEKLGEKQMLKPEQSVNGPRFIGLIELCGSIGFALFMLGAFYIHLKKKDYKTLPLPIAVFTRSVIVALYRF